MSSQVISFESALAATRRIAADIAAKHAADVDSKARFPQETVQALREAGLLSTAIPRELGGAGLNMRELGALCAALGQACGSSAMVLAMHHIQVACLVRHSQNQVPLLEYLRSAVKEQYLLASITSEVGTFGDTRSSLCAVERLEGGRLRLNKEATTGSYCAQADGILVTARRDADAPTNDQVLVLVRKGDYTLTQTTSWDTMGMRGTCSPGFRLESTAPVAQILPEPFADISTLTMVPYSHILWSALWSGIAADAVGKAASMVRAEARKQPGTVPGRARPLAEVSTLLQTLRHNWQAAALEFDEAERAGRGAETLQGMAWALKMTQLKVAASEMTPRIVHEALQIVGIMGYKNDHPLSLSRQYRDALSGALMIANDRVLEKSAAMLLVFKDE